MFAVYLLFFFLGAFLVMVTMFSAIRTVVVPRGRTGGTNSDTFQPGALVLLGGCQLYEGLQSP